MNENRLVIPAKKFDQSYVANGGTYCPLCEEDDVWVGSGLDDSQSYEGVINRGMECHTCGAQWTEVFNLVGITSLSLPKAG